MQVPHVRLRGYCCRCWAIFWNSEPSHCHRRGLRVGWFVRKHPWGGTNFCSIQQETDQLDWWKEVAPHPQGRFMAYLTFVAGFCRGHVSRVCIGWDHCFHVKWPSYRRPAFKGCCMPHFRRARKALATKCTTKIWRRFLHSCPLESCCLPLEIHWWCCVVQQVVLPRLLDCTLGLCVYSWFWCVWSKWHACLAWHAHIHSVFGSWSQHQTILCTTTLGGAKVLPSQLVLRQIF